MEVTMKSCLSVPETAGIVKTIEMGFAQTAQKQEVKPYLRRGKEMCQKYSTMIAEFAWFAEGGANRLIKHGWMEEEPQADDREQFIRNQRMP